MKKLLIDPYANLILFDEDSNSIEKIPEDGGLSTAFVADADGRAISKDEVVDYKAGDVVIVLRAYKDKQWTSKIVICNDVFAKDDLINWYKSLKEDEIS